MFMDLQPADRVGKTHSANHTFSFTLPYLTYCMEDLNENSYLGYSMSSASHGEVRFSISFLSLFSF